jgi:hypothetical protein
MEQLHSNEGAQFDTVLRGVGSVEDIGLVESPFQHTCLKHLQDCVVIGN